MPLRHGGFAPAFGAAAEAPMRSLPPPGRTFSTTALVLVVLLVAGWPGAAAAPVGRSLVRAASPGATRPDDIAPPPGTNISYTSSVDGFRLSYLEWLPAGYTASQSYPLAVFLHGIHSSNGFIEGGAGGINDISYSLTSNASSAGFILISLNTRLLDGFYINSPCGGPEEQDVLDAIAHEESLHR